MDWNHDSAVAAFERCLAAVGRARPGLRVEEVVYQRLAAAKRERARGEKRKRKEFK